MALMVGEGDDRPSWGTVKAKTRHNSYNKHAKHGRHTKNTKHSRHTKHTEKQ